MTALFEIILMPSSVVILETLTARRSILFLLKLYLHSSIFEGDVEIFINDIRSGKLSHSSCSHIIKDILSSISSLLELSLVHLDKATF